MKTTVLVLALAMLCYTSAALSKDDAYAIVQTHLADPVFKQDLMSISLKMATSVPGPVDANNNEAFSAALEEHLECGLCTLAVNEVFALLQENDTMAYVQEHLLADFCPHVPAPLVDACKALVTYGLPDIANLGTRSTVSKTCVDMHMCAQPPTDNAPVNMDVPTYEIDLDAPPAQHFAEVCANTTYVATLKQFYANTVGALPDGGKRVMDFSNALAELFPQFYREEQDGCAAAANVPAGFVTFFQIAYTASDACTSMVTNLPGPHGDVPLHLRNLDFWNSGTQEVFALKALSYDAVFTSKGKEVYRISALAGMMGALSGMNAGHSVTVDTRFMAGGLHGYLEQIVKDLAEHDATLVLFATRDSLANGNDFAAARKYLSSVRLPSSVYYTVSGVAKDEGVILARNATGVVHEFALDSANGVWFVAVTNYCPVCVGCLDWGQAACPNKDQPWFDDRLTPLVDHMLAMGPSGVSLASTWAAFEAHPTTNFQTTYSIQFVTANSTAVGNEPNGQFYQTKVRNCIWPCAE